jgi:hypothetical protein
MGSEIKRETNRARAKSTLSLRPILFPLVSTSEGYFTKITSSHGLLEYTLDELLVYPTQFLHPETEKVLLINFIFSKNTSDTYYFDNRFQISRGSAAIHVA